MAVMPDTALFQKKLAGLPLASYRPGDTVVADGSTTGRLFVLKKGVVVIMKNGVEVGTVAEPGAVFGELSVLLRRPHTADVVAVEASQFYVADTASEFMRDPVMLLYVAMLLAQRLDRANEAVIDLKHQIETGHPIGETVER